MKVLVTELIWPEGLEELEASGEVEYDPDLWQKPEEVRAKARTADAVVVRNQTRVDAALLESGGSLRAVGRLGVGLDNIDLGAARTRGVPVVYARNANAVAVAEYVMSAVLLASRNLSAASADVKSGGWDRRRFGGFEVYGKTLGLVGAGEISRRVARRASSFGMSVVGHDPYVAPYDYPAVELGIELLDLDAVLEQADFISLHVPLTPGTRHLLSLESFRKMKPHAWVINTSRGGVVNEADLAKALDEELIGGAVLDVLESEPPQADNPLLAHDRVVLTPHVAGLTEEAQVNTSILVAREVAKVLRGQPSLCVVG
jgi:D-3-phosphoglycerate dehydrogenase/(S)-sulfolactate dehydrogenase